MGIWDDLTGKTAANASRAAAADTYSKQQKFSGDHLGRADEYAENVQGFYQPYADTGAQANTALARLMADPSSLRSLPGYQFAMDEGVQALDRSANRKGGRGVQNGALSKDLLRFGTGLADQTFGNQWTRLLGGVTGVGMPAAAGQSAGETGRLNAQQSVYGQLMNSAGTIGQGDIAAANARSAGIQNLFNTGANLAGKAIGGGFGGFGGGGGFQTVGFDSYGNPNYGRV
jgi:hypothetical protein